ncbi:hypothetical protein IFT45_04015 [Frigoribacterium sp. CFBP 13707]|nr:hypothetical protein [Frigoribacterium sp. CFBP 13707]
MPSSLPARLPSALAAGLLATGLLLAGPVAAPAAPASAAPAPAPTTASLPKDQLVVPPSALARADALDDAPTTGPVVHTLWVSTVSATAATTDDTVTSLDRASIDAAVTALHDYWWEESGGRVDVRLGGVEERSLGGTSCDASTTLSKVKASAFGGSFASYGWAGTEKHLLVLPREACGTQAFGTIGGDGGEIVSSYGLGQQLGVPVLLHEFGHNLGLGHAGSALCRSTTSFDGAPGDFRSTADAACPTEEYGDHLDIMGYSVSGARPHLSSPQRMRLGWLPSTVALSTPATTKRVVLPSCTTCWSTARPRAATGRAPSSPAVRPAARSSRPASRSVRSTARPPRAACACCAPSPSPAASPRRWPSRSAPTQRPTPPAATPTSTPASRSRAPAAASPSPWRASRPRAEPCSTSPSAGPAAPCRPPPR